MTMDPRNLVWGPKIEANRAQRVVPMPALLRPTPSFLPSIQMDSWAEGAFPEGRMAVGSNAGVGFTYTASYHKTSDYYYGWHAVTKKVMRQSATTLGNLSAVEEGPLLTDPTFPIVRTDHDDATPRYIFGDGTKIYYAEGEFGPDMTLVEALDFADYGGARVNFSTNWDCDGLGLVLVGQYVSNKADEPWRVFMSEDFGATWRVVFNAADHIPSFPGNGHIHSVRYDPYSDLIWVSTGDNFDRNEIFVTADRGREWNKVFGSTKTSTFQDTHAFTELMVFEDHVAAGCDDGMFRGIVVIRKDVLNLRVLNGQPVNRSELDWVYTMQERGTNSPFFTSSNQQGTHGIGTRDSETYVGYVSHRTRSGLLATKDGIYWREIWRAVMDVPNPPHEYPEGIRNVQGPDSNGMCVGNISAIPKYPHIRFAFKTPTWR